MKDALVVGAGPAGIAAVGHLVAKRLSVCWIDQTFRAGALARYAAVPANTKLDVLIPALQALRPRGTSLRAAQSLHHMKRTAKALPLNDADPAPLGWTRLGTCATYMQAVTSDLMCNPLVSTCNGTVLGLHQQADQSWAAEVRGRSNAAFDAAMDSRDLVARAAVLAVGGEPVAAPPGLQPGAWALDVAEHRPAGQIRVLPLEAALQPQRLNQLVRPGEVVGVIGGGHTGLVVTMNLLRLRPDVKTVRLFVRRPIQLAEWNTDTGAYDGWAFRGLKGEAAAFALRHGLVDLAPPNDRVADRLELHDSTSLSSNTEVATMDAAVFCLGYRPAQIPMVVTSGHRHETRGILGHQAPGGQLFTAKGPIHGLYGLGLAFSDDEWSSGEAYGEVGFMPFAGRAAEVAERIDRERRG
jgi:hypothetical protein